MRVLFPRESVKKRRLTHPYNEKINVNTIRSMVISHDIHSITVSFG